MVDESRRRNQGKIQESSCLLHIPGRKSQRPDRRNMETVRGLVSIIVGCYNVAEWLQAKKLSCLTGQTYTNIEIILVDDGSTDDTAQVLSSLSGEDSRIRIITKENGGLGSARNSGIDAARGEYLWFYDVDDEADVHLVESNVEWMEKYGTDLNIFSFTAITPAQGLSEEVIFGDFLVENNSTLHDIFLDKLFFVRYGNGFAWNKFYRREFLERHGILFGNQRIQQDELFNLKIYPLAERVYISSAPLYNYFIYEKGNTRSRYIPKRHEIYIDVFKGLKEFAKKWAITDKRLEAYCMKRLYDGLSVSVTYNLFHPESPSSNKAKKQEFLSIVNHPAMKECIAYMSEAKGRNIEQKLYYQAISKQSFSGIRMIHFVFSNMRKLRLSSSTKL